VCRAATLRRRGLEQQSLIQLRSAGVHGACIHAMDRDAKCCKERHWDTDRKSFLLLQVVDLLSLLPAADPTASVGPVFGAMSSSRAVTVFSGTFRPDLRASGSGLLWSMTNVTAWCAHAPQEGSVAAAQARRIAAAKGAQPAILSTFLERAPSSFLNGVTTDMVLVREKAPKRRSHLRWLIPVLVILSTCAPPCLYWTTFRLDKTHTRACTCRGPMHMPLQT
jgi:hypothetical protein